MGGGCSEQKLTRSQPILLSGLASINVGKPQNTAVLPAAYAALVGAGTTPAARPWKGAGDAREGGVWSGPESSYAEARLHSSGPRVQWHRQGAQEGMAATLGLGPA